MILKDDLLTYGIWSTFLSALYTSVFGNSAEFL